MVYVYMGMHVCMYMDCINNGLCTLAHALCTSAAHLCEPRPVHVACVFSPVSQAAQCGPLLFDCRCILASSTVWLESGSGLCLWVFNS
jgi:hypothetical protein